MKWNSNHENVHLQSALIRAPLCGRPTAIRPSARPTVHLFFWNIFYPFCLVLIAIISLHTQKAFWWRLCSWCQGIFSSLGTICMYSTCMLKMKGMTDLFRNPFFFTIAVNQLLFLRGSRDPYHCELSRRKPVLMCLLWSFCDLAVHPPSWLWISVTANQYFFGKSRNKGVANKRCIFSPFGQLLLRLFLGWGCAVTTLK